MTYVELHCHSSYSFLDGASLPEELAARAAELGYPALALTDHDGVYGSLEFAHAAKELGVRPITGAEVTLSGAGPSERPGGGAGSAGAGGGDGSHLTLLVEIEPGLREPVPHPHRGARGHPSAPAVRIASRYRRPSARTSSRSTRTGSSASPAAPATGSPCTIRTPPPDSSRAFGREHFFVELQRPFERGDVRRNAALRDLADHLGVDTVATGNVHAHAPRRTLLQDTLVAIRCHTSLDGCEQERRGNRESILRAPAEAAERFAGIDPAAAARTVELAERLQFDLTEELGYRYPDFSDGVEPAIRQLAAICNDAFADRYPPL